MSQQHHLDVAWLEPPEPMEQAIAALESLPDGDVLVLRIHRQPYPLYDMLRNEGYCYQCEPTEDGLFRITISRPA
ncbi:DUF2249 domain-containing protein [Chitinivorax sp. PXF-14]|uniref:DUF2249 domain-containing protein n=1 Tax=Chitinivorax sp. PXF-14 TaxID=3230488 RepID=UPI003465012B